MRNTAGEAYAMIVITLITVILIMMTFSHIQLKREVRLLKQEVQTLKK